MPVISFVSSKGGVGKTTGAVILAGEIASSGQTVTLIDADPNRPLAAWQAIGAIPSKIHILMDDSADTIIDTIDNARKRTDFVIVDLEGTATDRIGFAITRSDIVLIPVQGSVLDANEAAKSIRLIKQMSRVSQREIDFRVYLSRISTVIREKTTKDITEQFREAGVPLLEVSLVDRAAFRALFSLGGTIHNYDRSDVGGLDGARENAVAFSQSIIDCLKKRIAA